MVRKWIHTIIIFILFFLISCGKTDEKIPDNRFHSTVYNQFETQKDIVYSRNITQLGVEKELKLDLYYPNDKKTDRPLIIFAHGGAFVSGNKSEGKLLAPFFAKSGYVVASIEYRLLDIPMTSTSMLKAVVDASADMKSAIRFLKNNAKTYGIDTQNIFIGGYSAGAFVALQTAYVDNCEEIESLGGQAMKNYIENHGGIEGNGGNSGTFYPIKGVFNISGAIGDLSVLDAGEPPLLSIHGLKDTVVPYGKGKISGIDKEIYGSSEIHKKLKELGVKTQFKSLEGGHLAILNCGDCRELLRTFIYQQL